MGLVRHYFIIRLSLESKEITVNSKINPGCSFMCNWRKLVKMLRDSEKNGEISKSLVVRSGAAFKISTFLGDSKLLKHSWTKPQLQASQGKMTNTNTNTNTYSHS